MKAVLFTYGFEDGKLEERMECVRALGYDVYYEDESDFTYKDYMKDVEVLVTFKVFKHISLDKFPKLKWIQLTSMGFEQVPKDEVLERDIIVTNNKNGYSIPMGEWAVLNILELMKKRKQAYKNQQNKNWSVDHSIQELYQKNVAFIGTGDTACESVKRLKGFDANIIGVNTNGRAVDDFDDTYSIDELDIVLGKADVVIITLPHTEKTHHLFDKMKLEKMKKHAFLINMSRGAVIKQNDLIEYLQQGNLGGVALDVFEREPLPKTSKLWDIDRVVITAHNSWISEEIGMRRWDMTYDNFKKYISDESLVNQVNIRRGY